MKKYIILMMAAVLIVQAVQAQKSKAGKEPPLIDRELFFDNPEIAGGQLSPDGAMISFQKVYKGKMNVWVKKFDEPFEKAKPVTADTLRPIGGYFWTYDSKYILYVQDKGGNENFNVYAVDPAAPAEKKTGVPVARNITPMENVRALIYNVSQKDPNILWVGLNNRDQAWHDLYKLEISTGKLTLLKENKDRLTGFYFDWDETIRLATRSADDGSTEILRADESGFSKIYDCGPMESCGPAGFFDKENKNFYLESNKGDAEDLVKLYLFNPDSKEVKLVEGDPLNKVDFGGVYVSDKTREIIYTTYTEAKTRWYFKDKPSEEKYNFLKAKFPGKEIAFASRTKDETKVLVSVYSDDDPGSVYFFDEVSKKVIKQYTPRPKLQTLPLARMEPITYKSSDGLEIPAYLTLPLGKEAKNLPLIVFPHGGPWARDTWGFNGYAQFLANRGYAVLLPNFRASTGYGKKFLNAGNLQWGEKMQDDITWGVKHLISKGIVDAKRVGIMGGSYGGYATLAGLTFTPDVYAAGVDIVGPSNLITLLNSIPPYWESIRKVFYIRMGDPSTPEGKAKLEKQSPLFSANKIKAPLLVVQGANDPRVKKAESDQIVSALRDLGIAVEYICAQDEGHGFRNPENNMAMLAYAEKFLAKHLGGRYQESLKPELAKKQKAILVDVKTVKAPEKVAVSKEVPKPVGDLQAGKYNYAFTMTMGAQNIAMDMNREIKIDNGKWSVTDAVKSPMGEMKDESHIELKTLKCLHRNIKQGPVTVDLNYTQEAVTGSMDMGNGKKNDINVKLENPIVIDGAGSDLVIARLPLKQDVPTIIEMLDVQTSQVKRYELKLAGTEKITVPAGSFDTYKITMNQVDGGEKTTFWISASDKNMIRTEAIVPQMGNAKMVAELK
ncbi:MAG TPA: prolyl oligopeptidase family serine peptidase [Ohtaekwangia sp.]|uniref:prolyl oligopeptidase family serine peptidase n=1 Tax=Ohtaekwangia sp. TaxID=2066019 RepID=UPI002F92EB50